MESFDRILQMRRRNQVLGQIAVRLNIVGGSFRTAPVTGEGLKHATDRRGKGISLVDHNAVQRGREDGPAAPLQMTAPATLLWVGQHGSTTELAVLMNRAAGT